MGVRRLTIFYNVIFIITCNIDFLETLNQKISKYCNKLFYTSLLKNRTF